MHIDGLSNRVINNVEGESNAFLDPLTLSLISLVISALFQSARLYCEIKTANEIRNACTNPSLMQKRMIKQKVSQCDINNQLTYREQQEVVKAILKTGASTTIRDIELALEAEHLASQGQQEEYGEWEV